MSSDENGRPTWLVSQEPRTTPRSPVTGQPGDMPLPEAYGTSSAVQEIKGRVHRKLLERLNLSQLDTLERAHVLIEVRKVLHELLAAETFPLNFEEREDLSTQILDEIFGYGPLEPLLKDPDVSDILVNTHKQVIVERFGKLHPTEVRFKDDKHLLQIIDRIVSAVGRRIDESQPMVDARLPDGSRVNAIIPPLAIDGPHMSIRKFKRDALSGEDLIRYESLTPAMLELLSGIVRARLNILISGGTGAGKTTLLNVLSSLPAGRRADRHHRGLGGAAAPAASRGPAGDAAVQPRGRGRGDQRALLINALRMRPDRIVVGEVRGSEAVDMLQAMNTGHDGSLTTLHANSPRDALGRLETMISMAGLNLAERAMRQQVASAIDVVIQVSRLTDGHRKVVNISEIVGMEGETVTMQDIFVFERSDTTEDGKVVGRFRSTGIRPRFADRLREYGIKLPATMFSDISMGGGGW
jgi:pilus assembly protein CpaF